MTTLSLATLEIAGSEIALPASVVREVVSAPERLVPVPRGPHWSLGSFVLRGTPIPVIDMAGLLSLPATSDEPSSPAARLIAIVSYRGALFGFVVAHVHDVVSIDVADCHATTRGRHGLIASMFVRADERPVYLIDPDALFALDELLTVQGEPEAGRRTQGAPRSGDTSGQATIVRVGETRFAISMTVIREIVMLNTIEAPALVVPAYRGHVSWRGRRLALLDPAALFGVPAAADGTEASQARFMVVLTLPCGEIALAVDEVAGPVTDSPANRVALAESERSEQHIAALLADVGFGHGFWVDHASLGADERVANYAALASRVADASAAKAAVEWARFAYLHFDAGGKLSVPIEDIDAVAEYPREPLPGDRHGLFVGRFVHEGHSVALVNLRRLLGREPRAGRRVLIVGSERGQVGFVVDDIERIDYIDAPTDSHVERQRGASPLIASAAQGCTSLVSIGEGSRQRFLAAIRLRRLAERLLRLPGPTRRSPASVDFGAEADSGLSSVASAAAQAAGGQP